MAGQLSCVHFNTSPMYPADSLVSNERKFYLGWRTLPITCKIFHGKCPCCLLFGLLFPSSFFPCLLLFSLRKKRKKGSDSYKRYTVAVLGLGLWLVGNLIGVIATYTFTRINKKWDLWLKQERLSTDSALLPRKDYFVNTPSSILLGCYAVPRARVSEVCCLICVRIEQTLMRQNHDAVPKVNVTILSSRSTASSFPVRYLCPHKMLPVPCT